MEYEYLVRDFALRTRSNLDTLKSLQSTRSDFQFYEVTQLINSMLGLLVFPRQKFVQRIPKTPLTDLALEGWPIPEVDGDYPQAENLQDLFRYLRNAIAHCNLEFLSDDERQITGLRIWNIRTDPKSKTPKRTWQAKLTIQDIEKITDKFIQLLMKSA